MVRTHNLEVIVGGNVLKPHEKEKKFISSYITDTRLMGVVGLYIHWEIWGSDSFDSDFHQFFYFDAEEFGLETYVGLSTSDPDEVLATEKRLIGGLGGKKIALTEKQARYLVQKFSETNDKMNLPHPKNRSEYAFLLSETETLSPEEARLVIKKMCTEIKSDYQLVHYFLMRILGRDLEGASYIVAENCLEQADFYKEQEAATLCKNTIELYHGERGESYLSESLIEINGHYKILVTETKIKDKKILSAKEKSKMNISPTEAGLMLSRSEFVSVFEIIEDIETFEAQFTPMMVGALETAYEDGKLFMEFNLNNDHVNQKIFRLNEDIHGIYYLSDYGQLIVAAYSLHNIREIETAVKSSPFANGLFISAKYEFKEPILYEFIQSDFEDFIEFIEALQ